MNKNKCLDFYKKNQVTTEHVDRENRREYAKKRRNLYRQLAIPLLAIRGAEILEIGPGVGHNTLPLILDWNCKHVDLVEPNLVAVNGLKEAFEEMKVDKERYKIFTTTLEEYEEDKKYDIVIAEGYIHGAHNWKELLGMIKRYTHENSIVIVTCMDEFGMYVERMKRLVGQYMVSDFEGGLEDKVKFLAEAWKDSFKCLSGMTRTAREWILDMVFNEMTLCDVPMTMRCAIEEMQEDFDVLGCSQNIFVDYSWYKDLEYDYIESFKKQYDAKKHMFLAAADTEESVHDVEINRQLESAIKAVVELMRQVEEGQNVGVADIREAIDRVTIMTDNQKIRDFNEEIKEILMAINDKQTLDFTKYTAWNTMFGKGLQYVSFQRR